MSLPPIEEEVSKLDDGQGIRGGQLPTFVQLDLLMRLECLVANLGHRELALA